MEKEGRRRYAPIRRTATAPLCAKCHSDAVYMRKFSPRVRVDEYAQYQTSLHGKRMAAGEARVATCSDCHRAHGVLEIRDARSPVAPAHVAKTCGACHADAARWILQTLPPSRASGRRAHAAALLERGTVGAHVQHVPGSLATPPGTTPSRTSAGVSRPGGRALRGAEKGAAAMGQATASLPQQHQIEPPKDTWVGLDAKAVCATCHDTTIPGADAITAVRKGFDDLALRMTAAREGLDRAEKAGMLVEDGKLALHDATEAHVRLRVLVHAFATPPFDEVLKPGVAAAEKAVGVGDAAMAELQYRRGGLAIATLVILGFLVTLYLKIRRLPPV
jgi:hypothetical protein